jgi:class 3 adenylate cyclase
MTKFAYECLMMFHVLTHELERQLGPETSDLKMRFGLSSGPVIGGVLLGGDFKFHIFGEYFYGRD